uniref:Major facilitator superfamily (MFS) profile domain-containing protein n=1 Tax=Chromera velia CCMP2878 TaxID=1169474 RepID=A0A0G4IC46_9ALVE|eukprot:Cvel_13010.t1-p1 / transcript=Cvel_13010.t1 / gene=Cvel_13010 / organism=Chromera_velia_CCMP2878 / gene_product=Multi-drug resistance efflux pump PmrA homolog, putative / transcript_product=Multi-drug resistance efflux pump PmrA homolog, putative / location=Cvel_scaffold873:15699-18532(-) / protein_length=772 / sequence_SO=supercontig / SO=protein_coding / is_pseudo=false
MLLPVFWLTMLFETLLFTVITPIAPDDLHLDPFMQGIVFAGQPFAALLMTLPAGHWVDARGWRRVLPIPYVLLVVSSLFLLEAERRVSFFVTARLIQGVSSSFLWPLALTAVSRTRPADKGAYAIGWLYTSDVGTLLGPSLGGFLYQWGGATVVFGFLVVYSSFLAVIALLCRIDRAPDAEEWEALAQGRERGGDGGQCSRVALLSSGRSPVGGQNGGGSEGGGGFGRGDPTEKKEGLRECLGAVEVSADEYGSPKTEPKEKMEKPRFAERQQSLVPVADSMLVPDEYADGEKEKVAQKTVLSGPPTGERDLVPDHTTGTGGEGNAQTLLSSQPKLKLGVGAVRGLNLSGAQERASPEDPQTDQSIPTFSKANPPVLSQPLSAALTSLRQPLLGRSQELLRWAAAARSGGGQNELVGAKPSSSSQAGGSPRSPRKSKGGSPREVLKPNGEGANGSGPSPSPSPRGGRGSSGPSRSPSLKEGVQGDGLRDGQREGIEGGGEEIEDAGWSAFLESHFLVLVFANVCMWAAFLTANSLIPLYWQASFPSESSPETIGLLFLPLTACKVFGGLLASFLTNRTAEALGVCLGSSENGEGALGTSVVLQVFILLGNLAMALSLLMLPFIPVLKWQASLLSALGAGMGVADASMLNSTNHYLSDREMGKSHGRAFAVIGMGFCFGAMVGPLLSGAVAGWDGVGKGDGGLEGAARRYANGFSATAWLVLSGCALQLWSLCSYRGFVRHERHERRMSRASEEAARLAALQESGGLVATSLT